MFPFNETAEKIRYYKNVGLDIKLLNVFAYSLELIFLLTSMMVMVTYLVISKMNRRFHAMLRILVNLLCCGMLVNSFFRLFMVPVRLHFGHDYDVAWVDKVDRICRAGQLTAILQIDVAVFLISIERLVATVYIRRYEHMFSSFTHKIVLTFLLLASIYGISTFLFFLRGDVYRENPQYTLIYITYMIIATNLTGMVLLRITQRRSQRHLSSDDHTLSKSYQCHENLSVVRLISPICVLLFSTRICQFIFRIYTYYVGLRFGAFMLRVLTHVNNVSLAVSVFLTPALLILLQPKFKLMFFKRPRRKLISSHNEAVQITAIYFDGLKKMWM